MKVLSTIVVVILMALLPAQAAANNPLVVVLSAYSFESNGKWLGESGPFFEAMGSSKTDVSAELPFCQRAFLGKIYNQDVLAVTMGVGKVAVTECAMNIINSRFMHEDVQFIWSGISGFSPTVGGFDKSKENTVIGDVCISHVGVDWDLTHSSMVSQSFWPLSWPNKSETFEGDKALAEELYQASLKVDWPDLPAGPRNNVIKYFGEEALRKPKAWYGNCAEATGDNFWHSSIDDAQARNKLSAVLGLPPEQIIAVTAMEQTGWANVLEDFAKITGKQISFAYVRSSSNFDQPWLDKDGREAVSAQQSIKEGMEGGGSSFGCITAALPVLKMLELRQ